MNMNLKGIMQTLGAKPGQVVSNPYARAFVPQPTITEAEGEDHEVSMANNSLDTIIKMATELKAKMGENEKDIPAWIQDHITNSENFISQASSNYHEYSTNEAGINGAPRFPSLDGVANEAVELPTTALPSTVKSKLMIAIDTIKDAELTYNQKVQVVKQVTDSLGIDKTEFNKIASRLKGTMESVNEVSYNVKADNAYQFINGAYAVLGMYLKDEKLESGVKSTLQRVVKDLEGLRKYFFSRKDESVNEGKTYSNKFAAWFTGTVLNTVKHPTYGTHQLTADQIQKASGDYKTKLFKAIEVAVKNGDITPDVIRKNESLRLTKLK
jgi:hypothetical protein